MTAFKPRDYQSGAVDAMVGFAKSSKPSEHAYVHLPTGSGKSVVIAEFCRRAVGAKKKVLVLCRQGELVQQNAERFEQFTGIKAGVYSASLNRKETDTSVIFATVQSVVNAVKHLPMINCILIDECHQIPQTDDSQYGQVINELRERNAKMRVFGLTASPYRLGSGMIHGEDKLFDECCYSVPLRRMLEDGHITGWSTPGVNQVDTSGIKVRGGEYAPEELSEAFIEKVESNAKEIIALTEGRNRVLVFATSVAHAEALQAILRASTGDLVTTVTGTTNKTERAAVLKAFVSPASKRFFLINVGVLTTGFDAPNVDAIAICRATKSAGLFYQILGRGMRRCEGKDDFLVLDFGGNFEEHGCPLEEDFGMKDQDNKILLCKECKSVVKAESDRCGECGLLMRSKECPSCNQQRPLSEGKCGTMLDLLTTCDYDFLAKRCKSTLESGDLCNAIIAETDEICGNCRNRIEKALQEGKTLRDSVFVEDKPEPEWWEVDEVSYVRHVPKEEGKLHTLRVTYTCIKKSKCEITGKDVELKGRFMEWVCFEHEGFAQKKAVAWWNKRSKCLVPETIVEAQELIEKGGIREPFIILVDKDGKWRRIVAEKFKADKPERVFLSFEEDDDCPF